MKNSFRILSTLAVLGTLAVVTPAPTIDFEISGGVSLFANANPLRNEYAGQGVTFSGVTGALNGGAVLHQDSNFGVNAHSGTDFLAFNHGSQMLNNGTPEGPERLDFAVLQSVVGIWYSGGGNSSTLTMSAFDNGDNLVDQDTVTPGAGQWGWVDVSSNADISYVILRAADTTYVMDDLRFDAVPEPATMIALGLGAAALIRRRKK